jgi:hypothetical protein
LVPFFIIALASKTDTVPYTGSCFSDSIAVRKVKYGNSQSAFIFQGEELQNDFIVRKRILIKLLKIEN